MNYLIEDGKVRGKLRRLPVGLPELLSDISREVMRCAPPKDCLLQFIMDYVKSIIISEEKLVAVDRIFMRAWRPVNELIPEICLCQMNSENQLKICNVMADCFKTFLENRKPPYPSDRPIGEFRPYEMVDELLGRCKLTDEQMRKSRVIVESNFERFARIYIVMHASDDPPDILCKYLENRSETQLRFKRYSEAAVVIQAGFRGFLVRRCVYLKYLRFTEAEMELAAYKIQRYYRKYLMTSRDKSRKKKKATSDQQMMKETTNVCGVYSLVDMDPKIDYDYILLRRRRRVMMMEEQEEFDEFERKVNRLRGRISEEGLPTEEEQAKEGDDVEQEVEEEGKPDEEDAQAAAEPEAAAASATVAPAQPLMVIESHDSLVGKKAPSDDDDEVTESFTGEYEDEMEGEFGSIEGSDDF